MKTYDDADICRISTKLKRWGRVFCFVFLVMGVLQVGMFVITLYMMSSFNWSFSLIRLDMFRDGFGNLSTGFTWIVRGVLIKLFAEGMAVIVQHRYIYSKKRT